MKKILLILLAVITSTDSFSQKKYDEIQYPFEGLSVVKLGGKSGYIDGLGNEIVHPKYDVAFSFSEGMALVINKKKYGFINRKGVEIIPKKYDYAHSFQEGLAAVQINKKMGYINKKGTLVIPLRFDYESDFTEGLAGVSLNDNCGYIDKKGEVVIPLKYRSVNPFRDGKAIAIKKDLTVVELDKNGHETSSPYKGYENLVSFKEGLYPVCKNGKHGYINKKGEEVIPLQYANAKSFHEGLAAVKVNGLWGYIDTNNHFIINPQYKIVNNFPVGDFCQGLASVQIDGLWGYINKNGRLVIPAKYTFADDFKNGYTKVGLNNKTLFIDLYGKEISYQEAFKFETGQEVFSFLTDKKHRYFQAKELNVAIVNDKTIIWDTLKEPVHFTIELTDTNAVINSGRKQTYRFLELLRKDDSVTKYYCIDEEQKNCVIWLFAFKNSPNWFSIGAEYSDVAWSYNCEFLEKRED